MSAPAEHLKPLVEACSGCGEGEMLFHNRPVNMGIAEDSLLSLRTQCQDEVRILSGRTQKLKVLETVK